jgi:hypothetical protein
VIAFTAAFAGRRHRREHRPGDSPHITGMGLSYVALLTTFYVDNGPGRVANAAFLHGHIEDIPRRRRRPSPS